MGIRSSSSSMDSDLTRRALFARMLAAAPLALLGAAAAAQETAPCVNLDTLPLSQKGLRRSLAFKLQSPDPKKMCGGCTFFTPSGGGCGKCPLLSGGAVAATSVCDSWAAKR
jgi:hypothetical protein